MPYPVPVGSILEVSIRGVYGEQRFISLFHYEYESPSAATDGRALIDTINPLFNAAVAGQVVKEYAGDLHVDAVLEEVVYQWVHPVRRARVSKTPCQLSGGLPGNGAPPNLAMALTKKSDTAGRAGIGTLHMPALLESAYDKGRFTLMGRDQYGALQTAIKAPLNIEFGENMIPVILHRADPSASPPIVDCFNNIEVRTMHRRTVGLGE